MWRRTRVRECTMRSINGRLFCVMPVILFLWLLGNGAEAARPVPNPPEVGARAHILLDFDSGRVLSEVDADISLPPASLTKIMTTYVIFAELRERNIQLQDLVPISEKAWRMAGSRMFIEVGKRVSVEDLLKGIIIQSGNDASVALAEFIAGDESAFAQLMNEYAQRLGMTASSFRNATGLPDPEHLTTPRDLGILASALIRDFPEHYGWHSVREFSFNKIAQYNRNKLLWRDESVDGIKTGHTDAAGYCLVASAIRGGMRLVSVVMGSASENSRAKQSQTLLNYGFRFFETERLVEANTAIESVRVWKGKTEQLGVGLTADLYVTVPRGSLKRIKLTAELGGRVMAPIRRGEERGTLRVILGEDAIVTRPLVALENMDEGSFWQRATDHVRLMFQ